MKIEDILILGGVAIAGYMVMRNTGGGGTSPVRYITNVPQALSPVEKPVVKEPDSTPLVINLPSESVTFPAPKLPSPTSLLPQIPFKNFEEPETPVVSAVTKESTPAKKKYTEPSPESWRAFTKEVWGAEPGQFSKSQGGVVASFSEIQRFGMPSSYINWLKNPYSVPGGKKEVTMEDIPQAWNPQATFYEQISGGLTTTKKEEKVIPEKASETKLKPLFYQSMWGSKSKTKTTTKTTTKKETKEKRPPALPGITWKKSGTGWIPVRS